MQRGEGPPCQLIRKRAAHQLSPYHLTLQREKGKSTEQDMQPPLYPKPIFDSAG